ncbi:hypothetical protein [Amycolatopsis thermophila]|uniref:Uncharacterized protein n=1 Tax=Amycolatopsis thermophila TaxID=206084 RepID=A0ABU0EQ18_9PSEU|nr:hypothetical protein [Amycolatopsis thermophila]MDQ0377259.1 hypothetical protein [Amycolatopsis thermophila]
MEDGFAVDWTRGGCGRARPCTRFPAAEPDVPGVPTPRAIAERAALE